MISGEGAKPKKKKVNTSLHSSTFTTAYDVTLTSIFNGVGIELGTLGLLLWHILCCTLTELSP